MLLLLLASVALGLGIGGVVLILGKLVGLPRWAAPLAGGAAMMGFMLWNEYTWFDRARAALPEDARIAQTYEHWSAFQPWTMALPRVTRFAAVAPVTGRPLPDPDWISADVILAARFETTFSVPHVFDCAGNRRAALPSTGAGDGATLDWIEVGPDDALLVAVCNRPENG